MPSPPLGAPPGDASKLLPGVYSQTPAVCPNFRLQSASQAFIHVVPWEHTGLCAWPLHRQSAPHSTHACERQKEAKQQSKQAQS